MSLALSLSHASFYLRKIDVKRKIVRKYHVPSVICEYGRIKL